MIIRQYYLTFEKFHGGILREALELRNQEFVRRNMLYSDLISWESHLNWHNSLDLDKNFYFLVRMRDEPIGVINIKDIDWEARRGEVGIFIGKESLLGTPTPFVCCLVLADLAVRLFRLNPFTKVKAGAREVERINHSLGFELAADHGHYMVNNMNIEKHYRQTARLRQAAIALSSGFEDPGVLKFQFNSEADALDPGCRIIRQLIDELPPADKLHFRITG